MTLRGIAAFELSRSLVCLGFTSHSTCFGDIEPRQMMTLHLLAKYDKGSVTPLRLVKGCSPIIWTINTLMK